MFQKAACIKGKQYYFKQCSKCKCEYATQRKRDLTAWFTEYKKTLVCSNCGNTDSRVFDFHHEDATTKEHNLADMIRLGFSKQNIMKEVNKCVCLCANCHRILHYDEIHGA